jgi:hypothetical protein
MAAVDYERAVAAQQQLMDRVSGIRSVNAVGIAPASDGYELKVNIMDSEAERHVPKEVDGVTVNVRKVGRLRKRSGRLKA